jgi:uncharacterized membrane protein YoaK (UPF0700 family)
MLNILHSARQQTVLALVLITTAGAINAGSLLAVGHYTAHMSGVVAQMADTIAIEDFQPLAFLASGLFAFIMGAACCGWVAAWARARRPHWQFALPVCIQGIIILLVGVWDITPSIPTGMSMPMVLLCFIMGWQNAIITRASGERIRTTHITGISTDIGIELGLMARRQADVRKLALLTSLLVMFFVGGLLGAYGFFNFGMAFMLPIGLVLLALSLPTLIAGQASAA